MKNPNARAFASGFCTVVVGSAAGPLLALAALLVWAGNDKSYLHTLDEGLLWLGKMLEGLWKEGL